MTYEEAVKVLKTIKDFYPDKFQLTENTIAMLVPEIEKMEYVPVMKRLTAYVWENPFHRGSWTLRRIRKKWRISWKKKGNGHRKRRQYPWKRSGSSKKR